MNKETINKVKHDGFGLTLEYTVTTGGLGDDKSITNDYVATLRRRVHPDMVEALAKLRGHVVELCEMGEYPTMEDIPEKLLSSIEVTGISIGGSGEHEGATIIAKRKLRNNRILNLVTPFTKFEDEHSPYKYESGFSFCVGVVIDEARQYLNGKFAPDPQLQLELK